MFHPENNNNRMKVRQIPVCSHGPTHNPPLEVAHKFLTGGFVLGPPTASQVELESIPSLLPESINSAPSHRHYTKCSSPSKQPKGESWSDSNNSGSSCHWSTAGETIRKETSSYSSSHWSDWGLLTANTLMESGREAQLSSFSLNSSLWDGMCIISIRLATDGFIRRSSFPHPGSWWDERSCDKKKPFSTKNPHSRCWISLSLRGEHLAQIGRKGQDQSDPKNLVTATTDVYRIPFVLLSLAPYATMAVQHHITVVWSLKAVIRGTMSRSPCPPSQEG